MVSHAPRREGDEWFCPRCVKRWAQDEEAPPCVSVSDEFIARGRNVELEPATKFVPTEKKPGDIIIN